jgi:2-C-methyl-D-erythritol 4-phosphate cytidylyltransferase
MSVAAVVVAGGQGVRFGGPKQFATIGDESVAERSVRVSRSVASRVVLVVPASYAGNGEGADVVVTGGKSRAESVRAGLGECADADVVVVHDAARPLASTALFHAVVDAVDAGADAAVPGLPITDTVKRVRTDETQIVVVHSVPRRDLMTVQTPQAFKREVLVRAHELTLDATDDASLVEALGGRVVVVAGEMENIKITQPGDLQRVASFMRSAQ